MSDLTFVAGDTAPAIFGTLLINGSPVNLSGALGVKFQMRLSSSRVYAIDAAATVLSAPAGTVRYDLEPGDLAIPGDYISRWQVTFGDGSIQHSEPENTVTVDPV